jgi:RNA polymerase sigma factor (sigma-70 family)
VSPNSPGATGRGNPQASEWLDQLRARFLAITARRVPAAVVEDLVQEALMIVVQRGGRTGAALGPQAPHAIDGLPPLAWCFQVLRNTIGNWYQRERTRRSAADPSSLAHEQLRHASAPERSLTPLEALEQSETDKVVGEALRELAATSDSCGRYLRSIADGEKPASIARREGLEESVLYRRIYRCREKLRELLAARGISV